MSRFFGRITEMKVPQWAGGGLRSAYRLISNGFFPKQPVADKTELNFDLCRQLYRNDGDDTRLGAGFCKAIIDRAVEFMGMPTVDSDDEERDARLNMYLTRYWGPVWIEATRNAMRDSRTFVRIHKPYLTDPLVTQEEREACRLTIVDPERVTVVRDPQNAWNFLQAIIVTQIEFTDEEFNVADPQRGQKPQVKEHEVWEVITPESYRYYDNTDKQWLISWERDNPDGFVPMIEVCNEYDSALSGGMSDYEPVYSFIKAFHEVLLQALKAHRYHSIPKLKFKVSDINGFLKSNFPDTLDENGDAIPGATINWKGREVLMMGEEDDLGFIEMKSILGDSKVLLGFLIECISVASETPQEFLMLAQQGQNDSTAGVLAFEKKTERKRVNFSPYLQRVIKMVEVMGGRDPITVDVIWDEIRVETIVNLSQALQQIVMSLEVLLERQLVSENTAREAIRSLRLFRRMKPPKQEALDAVNNVALGVLSPAQTQQQTTVDPITGRPKLKALPSVVPSGGPGAKN